MLAGPRGIRDAPTFTPSRFGLLSVAQQPPPGDAHWQNGVLYRSRCPAGGTTYDECITVTGAGAPPPPPAKSDNVSEVWRAATPFTVYAEFDCSPVGLEDAVRVAQDALARVEGRQAEEAFWTGFAGAQETVFPHLAADAEVLDSSGAFQSTLQTAASLPVTGTGPFDVAEALGLLEGALASCYAGVGVVHVPARALATLDAYGLVKASGDVLKTLAGNLVAVGAGYPGTSPAGTAAAEHRTWLYATGAVFLYRNATPRVTRVGESIDRSNNTLKMIAERTYVIGWECCHLAVQVALGTTPTSEAT